MTPIDEAARVAAIAEGLHQKLADSHASLRRGQVWCRSCGFSQLVDSAYALKRGWPKHCGYTMTIDSPEELKHLKSQERP